jgi:hypothetical protein
MSQALEKHVPTGVAEQLDERYDPADRDAFLDVFVGNGPFDRVLANDRFECATPTAAPFVRDYFKPSFFPAASR